MSRLSSYCCDYYYYFVYYYFGVGTPEPEEFCSTQGREVGWFLFMFDAFSPCGENQFWRAETRRRYHVDDIMIELIFL